MLPWKRIVALNVEARCVRIDDASGGWPWGGPRARRGGEEARDGRIHTKFQRSDREEVG
jgi:hypothetical protein